jgi:thiol-disulfide isomerase/thioredoxin
VWTILCGGLAASALFGAFAFAGEPAPAIKMGEKVTPFELKDSDAKPARLLDALKGAKAVVIDFWSARCPVSEKYEPVLKKLAADYTAKGVVFLAIDANFNEPSDEVQKVQKARGVPYRVLMDGADGKLAAYFGASHTPEAYLLTPAGVLVYHGNLDEIGGAIDAVLAGKAVPKAETKAFGCSIKRPK